MKLKNIIISLLILIINLSYCILIGNYCLNKNNYQIATTLYANDIVLNNQLNSKELDKYNGQYISINNYIVKELNYGDNNVNLGMYVYKNKSLSDFFVEKLRHTKDNPEYKIYINIQDVDKTLKHQLKKGDIITIEGKLTKYEELPQYIDIINFGKRCSLSLDDYKITNINTSSEIPAPNTAIDSKIIKNSKPQRMLDILKSYINHAIENYNKDRNKNTDKLAPPTFEELQTIHKNIYPETNREIATDLTTDEIKKDELENYKVLKQYDGQYIRITNCKYNNWQMGSESDSKTNRTVDCIYLLSNIRKFEETASFKPTIDMRLFLDSTDIQPLNTPIKTGDKLTIEGKLKLDSNNDRLTLYNCRIVKIIY